MANVNIVNVTSIYAGNAAWSLTTGLYTTLWTVSADVLVKINTIIAVNTSATVATNLTVDINGIGTTITGVTGASLNTNSKLAHQLPIPGSDVLSVIDRPVYLMENDILRGGASIATVELMIFFEVMNDA